MVQDPFDWSGFKASMWSRLAQPKGIMVGRPDPRFLYAVNVRQLTNAKIHSLEEWLCTTALDAYAVVISEVRRVAGRRHLGGMVASWTLGDHFREGVALLLSQTAVDQCSAPIKIIMPGRILPEDPHREEPKRPFLLALPGGAQALR